MGLLLVKDLQKSKEELGGGSKSDLDSQDFSGVVMDGKLDLGVRSISDGFFQHVAVHDISSTIPRVLRMGRLCHEAKKKGRKEWWRWRSATTPNNQQPKLTAAKLFLLKK